MLEGRNTLSAEENIQKVIDWKTR